MSEIDAHADLNTPASSPSHHFHGMPLRVLVSGGNAKIIELLDSVLSSSQVFLVGARDFDPPEQNYIQQKNISLFTPEEIKNNSQNLIEAIADSDRLPEYSYSLRSRCDRSSGISLC